MIVITRLWQYLLTIQGTEVQNARYSWKKQRSGRIRNGKGYRWIQAKDKISDSIEM